MKMTTYLIHLCLLVLFQSTSQIVPQTTPQTSSYLKQAEISEAGGNVHIVANSARPLEQVLDALQQKYGWLVDYEDPQYSKAEVVERPDSPGTRKLPAGGRFTVEFPPSTQEEEKILQLVVDSYNRSDNPGRFELRKGAAGVFFIVGNNGHEVRGKAPRQAALFDTPVTLASRQRTISETLVLLCKNLTERRGIPVNIGITPRNLLSHAPATVGGTKIPARDLLLRTLATTHRDLYWRLLFDPNSNSYFLNIHLAKKS